MDEILQEMSRTYGMFCLPRIVLDEQTREIVSFENVWQSAGAEAYYKSLEEILKLHQAYELRLHQVRCPECGFEFERHHALCPSAKRLA